ncbi:MAG TPA: hypothetical protein VIF15_00265 [Polyangiaceae bacterium]
MPFSQRLLVLVSLACASFAVLAGPACGGRTGLLVPEGASDAGADRPVVHDAAHELDVEDALPPIEASFHDVPISSECPDAASTLVYVLTQDNQLYSFYPPTLGFLKIGDIACPSAGAVPFSMAVDRKGIAYSVFTDGSLFRLSTATAACQPTKFSPGQDGFITFGMGYAADTTGPGETLFVGEGNVTITPKPDSRGLASIDTTAFALHFVGPFAPPIPGPELTGTGDGRLFGFYTNAAGSGSHIVEIDKASGKLAADSVLQVGTPQDGYAFAFWGGDFWVFTSSSTSSVITRFRPSDGSETAMGTTAIPIVGAGVSTCAPGQ